jgi:uncharacterized protein YdaT
MGLIEEAQALEQKWAKAKIWLDKAKEDRDWLEGEIDRLNEMLAAREALLDSANVREELLKSENARHMREKQELIGKFRRVSDVTEETMDFITQIRMADESPKGVTLSPMQAEDLLRELSNPKPRGLRDLMPEQVKIPEALVRQK